MTLDLTSRPRLSVVPALLGASVAAQVIYPLVSGALRASFTVTTVCLVAAAAFVHAAVTRGTRALLVLVVVCVVGGFGVEVLGVHTGVPFGEYEYTSMPGPYAFDVPVVIALAWPMLAWPAALAARRLCPTFVARVVVGAWALAAWDLFLDPQMVAAGRWRWLSPDLHLPGVPGVPITDYAGWLVVSFVISLALQGMLHRTETAATADDRWPLAFYVWTWAASTVGLTVFLGLPVAALWGTIAMGAVAVPVARALLPSAHATPVRAR